MELDGVIVFSRGIAVAGEVIDVLGVVAIVVGVLYAAVDAAVRGLRRISPVYTRFKRVLGRAILLGLELLVAADIIKTVAVTPTLDSVVVLAVIVLIRTFLSWSLELEISGRWPWQKRSAAAGADDEPASTPPRRSAADAGRQRERARQRVGCRAECSARRRRPAGGATPREGACRSVRRCRAPPGHPRAAARGACA